MRFSLRKVSLRRLGGSIAAAGLAVLCLGAASRVSPVATSRAGAVPPVPGAGLGDDAIASLPTGIRRLLADTSWVRAIQHYGERRLRGSEGFPSLGDLIESARRLDPEFRPAAVVGSLLLAEAPPFGAGEPQRADLLLADWTARHPRDFDAVLVRSLLHHWHLGNPAGAAGILRAAADRGDAPAWLAALAARALTEVGSREAARILWRALQARAEDQRTRANAHTHLLQLDALDQRDRLARAVRQFERGQGRPPQTWAELVAAGLLPEAPADPAGVPFVLDPEGVPGISPDSPLAGYPGR